MILNYSYQRAVFPGLIAFLVLATISGAITTFSAQTLVVALRILAGLVVFCSVVAALSISGLKRTQLYAIYIYIFIVTYGALWSVVMGGSETGFVNIERDLAVGSLGVMAIAAFNADENKSKLLARVYCFYALLVLFVTILLGGLTLDFPPAFRFEYMAASLGKTEEQTYSLGISSFFGFASVSAALLAKREANRVVSSLGMVLAIFFLSLSLLGGGRGESLAAFFLIVLLFTRKGWLVGGVVALLTVFYYLGSDLLSVLGQDFLFIKRFSILFEGDLSSRDVLLRQGFNLLRENPNCLFFGCGLGYFQSYYQYEFGYYPHNILVEAVISYGLPLVVLGLMSSVLGVLIHLRKLGSLDVIFLFFVYAAIVSLKSGYFLGSWMVLVLVCYFSAAAIERYMSKRE